MKNFKTTLPGFIVFLFLLSACGGGGKYKKSPLDEFIRDMPSDQVFSIILYDMDVQGNFIETFHHQYRIISESKSGEVDDTKTGWLEVSEREFNSHINDMGMEIAARDSTGKLHKAATPPGYTNYVGNSKYGQWTQGSNGSSFWSFYGKYAFMSSMFNMMAYPVNRSYYRDWRGGYYGTGRGYYGPSYSGRSYYGTNSSYGRSTNSSSSWSRNTSSFKRNVASRTSRSTGTSGGFRSKGSSFGK